MKRHHYPTEVYNNIRDGIVDCLKDGGMKPITAIANHIRRNVNSALSRIVVEKQLIALSKLKVVQNHGSGVWGFGSNFPTKDRPVDYHLFAKRRNKKGEAKPAPVAGNGKFELSFGAPDRDDVECEAVMIVEADSLEEALVKSRNTLSELEIDSVKKV